jgi:hypothetical protein
VDDKKRFAAITAEFLEQEKAAPAL